MSEESLEVALAPGDWAITFLEAYAGPDAYGTISKAARVAGVHPKAIARRRQDDTVFAELMTQVEDEIRDLVRHEVFRRALEPTERPIFQRGEMVGTIQEYDNRHLEWLAERFMPEEFHLSTKIELSGTAGSGDFEFRMSERDEDEEQAEVSPPDA